MVSRRACASSETESEAGDIVEQQLEEMNKQLNSVTDPTGFLRMVRHNNLLHRYGTYRHLPLNASAPSTGRGAGAPQVALEASLVLHLGANSSKGGQAGSPPSPF